MTHLLHEASLSVRLWRRDRRRNRAAQTVVNQLGWSVSEGNDWVSYPKPGTYGNCPYCGGKAVTVRSENWVHRETDDLYGVDLHWCNNKHMWLGEYKIAE